MLTAEAKKYGLHKSNPKERMKPRELMALLDGLGVTYPADAGREKLVEILTASTPPYLLPHP